MSQSQPLRIPLHGFQQDDTEHSKWAKNYLAKKGVTYFRFSNPEDEDLAECVIIPLQESYENIDYNGIYKNMPLAWSQRKRRQESGLKHYSFFMDEGVGPALFRLASRKGSSMSSALEALILEDSDLAEKYEKKYQTEMKALREDYRLKKETRLAKMYTGKDKKKISRLEKMTHHQQEVIAILAQQLATREAADKFSEAPELNSNSLQAATERKEEILSYYQDPSKPVGDFPPFSGNNSAQATQENTPTETTGQGESSAVDREPSGPLKD